MAALVDGVSFNTPIVKETLKSTGEMLVQEPTMVPQPLFPDCDPESEGH